jgi:hypothetical protein
MLRDYPQDREIHAVRPDLKELPIPKTELKRLSGLDIEAVNHFSIPTLLSLDPGPDSPGLIRYLLFLVAFAVGLTYPVAIALLNLTFPFHGLFLSTQLVGGLFLTKLVQFFWVKKHVGQSLPGLLHEVERFNDIIRVIDINDRLEEVGNPDVHLRDREQVLEALQLTKEDLIRALRTERILRKHKTFIARNPEIFANNLTALAALQVTDKASEHGRLLNEALQIALSAHEEIGKLSPRPPSPSPHSPDST